ncbi:protein kinase, putative [Trypanosoma cruzi marinkellei]|uniref:Protein kinase, putative n=1 Tax=Trypanosoma cruzi marinkellei TaxID=85056 RepID=K2NGB8_TRYCR|nr:protein kinase, putative [Trypanosoma cruzi marinkellei]
MERSQWYMQCRSYVALVCTAVSSFSADHPTVSLSLGVTAVAGALAVYVSTGSPRWKGAPILFRQSRSGSGRDFYRKNSRPTALTAVCTSTKTPWLTDKEDEEDVLSEAAAEISEALHADVDSLSLPSSSNLSFQQPHRSHRCYKCSTVCGFCESPAVMRVSSVASFSSGALCTHCFFRSMNGRISNSSGLDTPTIVFSGEGTPAVTSLVGNGASTAAINDWEVGSHLGGIDWKTLSPLTSNRAIGVKNALAHVRDCGVSEASTSPATRSLKCVVGGASDFPIASGEECISGPRGYDCQRQFGETDDVSGGNLQQTLSHLIGAADISCLPQVQSDHTRTLEDISQGWEVPQSGFASPYGGESTGLNTSAIKGLSDVEVGGNASGVFSNLGIPHLFSKCTEGCSGEQMSTETRDLGTRHVQVEAQLRSLEKRLEQQLRGSIGHRCDAKPLTACHGPEPAAVLHKSESHLQELLGKPLYEGPDGIGLSQRDNSLPHHQGPPVSAGTTERLISASPQQHDRRVDDVFVRPRGDGAATYSLSLTYHDAHGALRTIDTHTLPPLKLSPRNSVVTPNSTATTGSLGSSGQHPLSVTSQEVRQYFRRPLANIWGGNSRANTGLLLAPLPPLEPTAGPRLQGVAGKRGELRIGAFLGGGCCGKVYECLNTETGEVLAAKQLQFNSNEPKLRNRLKQLELELEVLSVATRHCMPWIVGFHGAEKRGHSVLMYFEYCPRGSLLDYMLSRGSIPSVISSKAMSTASLPSFSGTIEPVDSESSVAKNISQEIKEPNSVLESSDGCSYFAYSRTPVPFFVASPASRNKTILPEMPPLPIEEVQRLTRQIVEALHFLHFYGYAHLDVKTANILVTEERDARLADFGCSMRLRRSEAESESCESPGQTALSFYERRKEHMSAASGAASSEAHEAAAAPPYPVLADDDAITELRGTAVYMAPEMIRFERHRIGTAGDVWSLGCVVMELVTGAAPWRHIARDKLRVLFRIGSSREDLPLPPSVVQAAEEARRSLAYKAGSQAAIDVTASLTEDARLQKKRRLESIKVGDETEIEADAANISDCDISGSTEHCRRMRLFAALENFLFLCLRIRPEDRPSCEELLLHPFLTIS